MKQSIIIVLMIINLSCKGQVKDVVTFTNENFETEFFSYTPTNVDQNISIKDFDWARFVISETQKQLDNDVKKYNVTHYWNIISAFEALDLDEEYLKMVFLKLAKSKGSCAYITSFKDKVEFDDTIPDLYNKYYDACRKDEIKEENFSLIDYIRRNNLDSSLVKVIHQIDEDDQKYRSADDEGFRLKQPILDEQNQILIDSLFVTYRRYLGESLVGEKYSHTMWSVIQHSNLKMMEKYLPIIGEAVDNNELEVTPFKMLIDRVYGLKYGYQVFGSQSGFGFEMADDKTRQMVKSKYNIE